MEFVVERREIWNVEPAMQRRDVWMRPGARQREMHIVDVIVDHIELAGAIGHLTQQEHVMGELIDTRLVEAQGPRRSGHEPSGSLRITAREQRHLMALVD